VVVGDKNKTLSLVCNSATVGYCLRLTRKSYIFT